MLQILLSDCGTQMDESADAEDDEGEEGEEEQPTVGPRPRHRRSSFGLMSRQPTVPRHRLCHRRLTPRHAARGALQSDVIAGQMQETGVYFDVVSSAPTRACLTRPQCGA